ncbi:histidinol-phosphatase HisJ family protein [soil metagenome]
MIIPQDYHMHSNFSCDCKVPMADMCRSAISKQMPEIGFSEHYDLQPGETCVDWFRPEPWFAELERCRHEFAGRLTIRAGIEIGEPHIYQAEAQAMLARYPFDYALGSLHWVGEDSVFDINYFKTYPADEAFGRFFVELEKMTRLGGFDILSHFDVPVRTAHAVYGAYEPERYEELIRLVLRNCIDNGIALDLNTKGLLIKANRMTPGLEILRWYAEMGGERITLGADAHKPEHVGAHLDTAMAIARQAGLKYLTYFKQRQATLVPF